VKARTSVMLYCAKILDTSLKAVSKILGTENSNSPAEVECQTYFTSILISTNLQNNAWKEKAEVLIA
jgi:hypothetical protein